MPAVTRFTALPFVTALAERRQSLRGALIFTAFGCAIGISVMGTQHQALAVLLAYIVTCCLWTPMTPLTDAYALRGVARYGLNYGPLRLWGSAAFVAGALACGLLVDIIAAKHLIWVIASVAGLGALASLTLQPLDKPKIAVATPHGARALLRDGGFVAIIVTSALIQASHAAYYTFASIAWQQAGFGGLTIAGLWALGVLAEIVLFALSPRFTLPLFGAGRDRSVECGGALGHHRAVAADRDPGPRATGAWADFWAHHGRHHGAAGATRARPCDGARAGLSRRLHRHRHQLRLRSPQARSMPRYGAGRLLRDGGDGRDRRGHHVAGAA